MVRLLSDAGADKDIATQGGGIPCSSHMRVDTWRWGDATPLLVASQSGYLEVVCLLSGAGADKDIAMQGGATRLFIASLNGHLEVVHLLSDAGADKDIAMQGDATPLLVASQQGPQELVCSHMQGPTRTSQCRAVALPCSSHLRMDT